MNRKSILASIHRQLRNSRAETGELRPLVEIVTSVASEIREDANPNVAEVKVIPIETVAAFVDGEISEQDERSVCDAVLVDNSVLAELIAAVRTTMMAPEVLPPLSSSLQARLQAMAPKQAEPPMQSTPPQPTPPIIVPADEPIIELSSSTDARSSAVPLKWIALAVAASIVAAIFLWNRESEEPKQGDPQIAEHEDVPPADPMVVPDELPDSSTPPVQNPEAIVVDDAPMPDNSLSPIGPVVPEIEPEAVVQDEKMTPQQTPEPEETSEPEDPIIEIDESTKLADVTWKEIIGLLAIRSASDPSSVSSTSRSNPTWRPMEEGANFQSSSNNNRPNNSRVILRTLPFSRAEGEFVSGGRVVVASDSGLTIDRNTKDAAAIIDLNYGSMAMIDFKEDQEVRLQTAGKILATMRWLGNATAVVHRQTTGLSIQVDRGRIEINDQIVRQKAVQIGDDKVVETIRAPRRLPRWLTNPESPTDQTKSILAQVATTNDLASALNQRVTAMAAAMTDRDDPTTLMQLAHMQVSMHGANLYRLAGSRVPVVRFAALQRLAQLPDNDPRTQRAWDSMERALNNPQRYRQVRTWFNFVRNGNRPGSDQFEQMLSGLTARDYAGRAVCDFILRQYVAQPPPFDPSWTGQTLLRVVNVYRSKLGLPARPNAAANAP